MQNKIPAQLILDIFEHYIELFNRDSDSIKLSIQLSSNFLKDGIISIFRDDNILGYWTFLGYFERKVSLLQCVTEIRQTVRSRYKQTKLKKRDAPVRFSERLLLGIVQYYVNEANLKKPGSRRLEVLNGKWIIWDQVNVWYTGDTYLWCNDCGYTSSTALHELAKLVKYTIKLHEENT